MTDRQKVRIWGIHRGRSHEWPVSIPELLAIARISERGHCIFPHHEGHSRAPRVAIAARGRREIHEPERWGGTMA
jgi:hypothetical protein